MDCNCPDDGVDCTDDVCAAGVCTHPASTDGTICSLTSAGDAVCQSGACVACTIDADCSDGEPCTQDTCDVNHACAHVGIAAGSPGNAAEGGCDGLCQTDGHCGLSAYSKPFSSTTTAWTRIALSQLWTGANAPPPRGIVAATHTVDQNVTMVFTEDGMFYRQTGTTWATPVLASSLFGDSGAAPKFDSININSFVVWHSQVSTSTPHSIQILTKLPNTTTKAAFAYDMTFAGAITFQGSGYVGAESESDAPPQQNTDTAFGVVDQPAYLGTAGWILFYSQYGDAVYKWNGGCPSPQTECWTKWTPASTAPFYLPATGAPVPASVVTAYKNASTGTLYILAP